MSRTLFGTLSRTFLLIVIGLSAVHLAGFFAFFRYAAAASDQLMNWSLASTLAESLTADLSPEVNHRSLRTKIAAFSSANRRAHVFFIDADGKVLGHFSPAGGDGSTRINMEPVRKFLGESGRKSAPVFGENPNDNRANVIFSVAPIRIGDAPGYLYLVLSNQAEQSMQMVFGENSAVLWAVLTLVLSIAVSATIGILIFRLVTRRFRKMTEVVARYSTRDFSARIPIGGGNDEVDDLSRTINSMADSIVTQVSELERRDRMRRELVANVAHDLRSPLVLIKGYLERIVAGGRIDAKTELGEFLEGVSRNAGSLERLLSDLFDLAKFESAEVSPQRSRCSMQSIIDDLALSYSSSAEAAGVELKVDVDDSAPPALADFGMMTRVLTNLLENALRYTPRGGTITLSVAREDETRIRVSVADSGVGISEDNLPRVFERFYQVEGGAELPKGLSGLGLAIVKRIVEAHGSTIELTSALGKGTTFSFALRTYDAALADSHSAQALTTGTNSVTSS